MARVLQRRGVLAKLRHSAGQDVDGGCGQLRARTIAPARGAGMSGKRPTTRRLDRVVAEARRAREQRERATASGR